MVADHLVRAQSVEQVLTASYRHPEVVQVERSHQVVLLPQVRRAAILL